MALDYTIIGERLKKARLEKNLTQEQFAIKLNVNRQAVSNWENNKNLPDIGMLILMSDVFQISLDQLVKGEDYMNNMTEKVIRDGSETRKARFNMITTVIGGSLLLIGVILLVIKGMSVEYIDADGILHENFFLVPTGFLCIFCGLISFVTVGIRTIVIRIKAKREKKNEQKNG